MYPAALSTQQTCAIPNKTALNAMDSRVFNFYISNPSICMLPPEVATGPENHQDTSTETKSICF